MLDGVGKLPDDRREALIMRFALGMDNREIARALGRSDGATKVLIHRAIRQLEGIVGENAPVRPRRRRHSRRLTMTEAAPTSRGCCAKRCAPSSRRPNSRPASRGPCTSITEMAAEELEAWELSAMRDPRNWVRPAAALAAGGAAATALVLLRAQASRRRLAAAGHRRGATCAPAVRSEDLERETRRLLGDR